MAVANKNHHRRLPDSGIRILHTMVERVCVALLVMMIIVTVYQVFMRSVVNRSASWSEEAALLMMIWFGYLGMALGIREDVHISIEFVFDRLPRRLQIALETIGRILIGVFSFAMLRQGIRLSVISSVQRLPATRLPRSSLYIILILSGFLMLIYILEALVKMIRSMGCGPGGDARG